MGYPRCPKKTWRQWTPLRHFSTIRALVARGIEDVPLVLRASAGEVNLGHADSHRLTTVALKMAGAEDDVADGPAGVVAVKAKVKDSRLQRLRTSQHLPTKRQSKFSPRGEWEKCPRPGSLDIALPPPTQLPTAYSHRLQRESLHLSSQLVEPSVRRPYHEW